MDNELDKKAWEAAALAMAKVENCGGNKERIIRVYAPLADAAIAAYIAATTSEPENDFGDCGGEIRRPATPPAATTSEPVAWVRPSVLKRLASVPRGALDVQVANTSFLGFVVPLFTTPPAAPTAIDVAIEALEEGRRAIGDHSAPHDCYATGPLTGDDYRDLVECPACSFIAMYDAARASLKATKETA